MNIRELRIGNWVKLKNTQSPTYIEVCSIDHEGIGFYSAGQIEPIPLTKMWLEKCGFEKEFSDCYQRFDYYIIPRAIRLSPKKEGFCWQVEDEIDDCNVDVPIKYLHQLQNIYFTLTGTELQIKERE